VSRDLHLLVGAVGVSALGDFLAGIPLVLHVEARTGSGLAVAAVFVALWSPAVLLAAPAGALVDRLDTRLLLIAVSLAQAGVAVALAFSAALVPVLALAALLGAGAAVGQPAEFALLPAVAGERDLARANGRVEAARYLGFTAGPLLGAALAAAGGMRIALLVDAASFVAVALAVLALRARRARPAAEERPRSAREGVVFLARDRVLRLVLTVAFVSLLFMTASAAAEVFFAKDVLGAGELGYGALLTAWTLGMVLGSAALAARVRPGALAGTALAAICAQSLGLGLPTLWLSLPLALALFALGGTAHGLKSVVIRTLIHERVPERLHGRAFAAYNGLRNGAELFALALGGVLIVAIGARWTLAMAGALPLIAGLAGLALHHVQPRRGREPQLQHG
jgi:MFS family permease